MERKGGVPLRVKKEVEIPCVEEGMTNFAGGNLVDDRREGRERRRAGSK